MHRKKIQVSCKDVKEAKGMKKKLIAVIYKCFKTFDVFGSSLQYLKYKKSIKADIAKEEGDILLTFSHPMTAHMIGKYCKDAVSGAYIQQWGDPLTTDIITKTALPRWIRKIIEENLIKKADRICYVSPLTCEEQKNLFKKHAQKMIFLPTPRVEYKKTSRQLSHHKVKIGYFGSYKLIARDIRPLYKAAVENENCELYIIGDSDIVLESKSNIFMKNRITREEIEKYVDEVDVLVCLMNSKGNQIPGKMYHYAGSYKEILVIKDGEYGNEIEKYFRQFDRYTFVENDKNKIKEILDAYSSKKVPDRVPLEDFSANTIAKKLLQNC